MKRLAAILVPLTLMAGQTQAPPPKEPPEPYLVTEGYRVYSSILSGYVDRSKRPRLLISQETKGQPSCLEPDADPKRIVDPAATDYAEQNKKTWLIRWNLKIDVPYEIVPRANIDSLLRGPGGSWALFEKAYPETGSWIELSAVGFNTDKTIAVVSISDNRDSSGSGEVRVLKLQDNEWVDFGDFGCGFAWAA